MDRGVWQAIIHGITKDLFGLPWWLNSKESICQCRRCQFNPWVQEDLLEKEMATHSSILTWEIPQTEEPGGLQSLGSKKSWTQLSS